MSFYVIQTTNPRDRQAWYGQDMLLALASLDLNPQLVLLGEGLQLWHQGYDQQRHGKSLHKRYRLLELYDCPAPLVLEEQVAERGWHDEQFIAPVKMVSQQELQAYLQGATKLLRF